MARDHFEHKAERYDGAARRVRVVEDVADAIRARIELKSEMALADFGAGTGLLLERIAPHVRSIAAIDVSPSMIAQLEAKLDRIVCEVEVLLTDLTKDRPSRCFDGIISSMTLHHIEDLPGIFLTLRTMIGPGGFLALADLDTEDGSFHDEDTGVHHHGFQRGALAAIAAKSGFTDVALDDAGVIAKQGREYPVFLLTARVPAATIARSGDAHG